MTVLGQLQTSTTMQRFLDPLIIESNSALYFWANYRLLGDAREIERNWNSMPMHLPTIPLVSWISRTKIVSILFILLLLLSPRQEKKKNWKEILRDRMINDDFWFWHKKREEYRKFILFISTTKRLSLNSPNGQKKKRQTPLHLYWRRKIILKNCN